MEERSFAKNVLLNMKQTKGILQKIEETHQDVDYYYSIIEIIESNVDINPDISIESCKSLMEGISKFTLKQLDRGYDCHCVDKLEFQPLFKKSLSKLAEYSDSLEQDFVVRASSLIQLIGEIRNKRGDISHGKLAPKEIYSEKLFSNLVMQITDGLVFYILNCFLSIEPRKEIQYNEFSEFNERLDEMNPIRNLSYSKALFEQDIVAYKQELSDYLESLEHNN